MKSTRPIRRKRGPTIAWTPASDSYYVVAGLLRDTRIPPLYLTQAAILDLEARFAASASPVPFGLLAGALCVAPDTDEEYLIVDEVIAGRGPLSSNDPLADLADELRSLSKATSARGRQVQGWYLGGMDDDLRLDPDGLSLHRAIFPEQRYVLLLRNSQSAVARGGVFRYARMTDRLFPIPFFELLPDGTRAGEQRPTAVRWANYRTFDSVEPLGGPPQSERIASSGRDSMSLAPALPRDPGAASMVTVSPPSALAGPLTERAISQTAAGAPLVPVRITFPALLPDSDETSSLRRGLRRLLRLAGAVAVGLLLGLAIYATYAAATR